MAIQVEDFVWLDWVVEKIATKHGVEVGETEEAFSDSTCKVRRAEMGKYRLYGRSWSGRYLFIIFAWEGSFVKVISARDMTHRERHYYGQK